MAAIGSFRFASRPELASWCSPTPRPAAISPHGENGGSLNYDGASLKERPMLIKVAFLLVVAAAFGARGASAQVTKQAVPGVQNFAKLETTVACGGATTPE